MKKSVLKVTPVTPARRPWRDRFRLFRLTRNVDVTATADRLFHAAGVRLVAHSVGFRRYLVMLVWHQRADDGTIRSAGRAERRRHWKIGWSIRAR